MTRTKSNAPTPETSKAEEIIAITLQICSEHLDTDYAELCQKMVQKLARKRPTPLDHGPPRTWAGGVLYAVGWVNFLTDPSQRPHMTTKQLAEVTGVGQSTLAAKFKVIRDALRLSPMDPEYSRKEMLRENPMAWMVTVNGLIMDARSLPQEVQAELRARGVIPDLR
jgi:hypothetical protein